jgi:hypothetical protein
VSQAERACDLALVAQVEHLGTLSLCTKYHAKAGLSIEVEASVSIPPAVLYKFWEPARREKLLQCEGIIVPLTAATVDRLSM